jgi:hypothetical protein
MTWGGTKFFFREIVTLETGDIPQKVFLVLFGPIGEDLLGESNPLDGVTHCGLAEN